MSNQIKYSYFQPAGFVVNTKAPLAQPTSAVFSHRLVDGKPNFKPDNNGGLQLSFSTSSGNSYCYLTKDQANALEPLIEGQYIILTITVEIPPITVPANAKAYTIK